jgi:Flp pilus assembly pilin Flp
VQSRDRRQLEQAIPGGGVIRTAHMICLFCHADFDQAAVHGWLLIRCSEHDSAICPECFCCQAVAPADSHISARAAVSGARDLATLERRHMISPERRNPSMPGKVALRQLWKSDEAQDIAEYAVMLAVIMVIVVGTIKLIGSSSNTVFSSVASSLN